MTLSEKAERFFVSIIYEPCMFVAIEVKTPEARNFLVNGLRSLMSSLQLDCSRQLSTFNECKSQERFSEDDQVDYKKKYEQLVSQVNHPFEYCIFGLKIAYVGTRCNE